MEKEKKTFNVRLTRFSFSELFIRLIRPNIFRNSRLEAATMKGRRLGDTFVHLVNNAKLELSLTRTELASRRSFSGLPNLEAAYFAPIPGHVQLQVFTRRRIYYAESRSLTRRFFSTESYVLYYLKGVHFVCMRQGVHSNESL